MLWRVGESGTNIQSVVLFSTTACLVRSKCGDRCLHCYHHMHHCTMSYCSWTWEHFFIIHATQVTLQTLWWRSSFPPQSHKTTGSLREPHCSASLVNKPITFTTIYATRSLIETVLHWILYIAGNNNICSVKYSVGYTCMHVPDLCSI